MLILTNNDWRARLSRHIDSAVERTSFELVAFVFIPEHVHLLVYPMVPEPEIGRLLAFIKQPFSKEIKQILIESKSELLERLTVRLHPQQSGKTWIVWKSDGLDLVECPILFA